MPRNGTLVRITLALAAVAACRGDRVAGSRLQGTVHQLSGAGSTFVSPLVSAWVSPVASALSITL